LESPACDRPRGEGADQKEAGRRSELMGLAGETQPGVEPSLESPFELFEILPETLPGVRMCRVGRLELDQCTGQEPLDLGHGGDQAGACGLVERIQERARQLVASPLEKIAFREPCRREPCRTDAPVGFLRVNGDEMRVLERADQPTEITRIEPESGAELTQVA